VRQLNDGNVGVHGVPVGVPVATPTSGTINLTISHGLQFFLCSGSYRIQKVQIWSNGVSVAGPPCRLSGTREERELKPWTSIQLLRD
jgi:hypothetical protein